MATIAATLLVAAASSAEPGKEEASHSFDPEGFLAAYCWDCHDELVQKGDRRLDDLDLDPGDDILMAERWEEVMHQLQLGEMPPSDKDQPGDEERRGMIDWVHGMANSVREKTKDQGDRVTHRRLNRQEYLYTVRDLFGITEGDFDPTVDFPADNAVEGFRNNGHALQMSPQLMERYFRSADRILEYVYGLVDSTQVHEPMRWEIKATEPKRVMVSGGAGIDLSKAADGSPHIALAHGLTSHDSTYDGKLFFKDFIVPGLEHSGWYEFTVTASGANRFHRYGDALKWSVVDPYYQNDKDFYDKTRPIQLGLGTQFAGSPQERRRARPNLRVIDDLPDNEYATRTYRVWLDQGSRPYLSFVNGPPKGVKMQFVTNRLWEFDKSVPRITPEVRNNLTERYKRNELYNHLYKGPEVHLREVVMRGPFLDEAPHAVTLLFGRISPDAVSVKPEVLRRDLARLASVFYRKRQPVKSMEPYAKLIENRLQSGMTYRDALRPVLKTFLCSPSFLYLTEEATPDRKTLTTREIATRLSYFLNASLPDVAMLKRLERSDDLPATLRVEVDALLNSSKAERFFELFADQWLGLDTLGSMPPGTAEFPAYYIHDLEEVGKEETYRFLAALIRENRPVTDLVNADFTFINRGLASLYDLPAPEGDDWVRVSLPDDSPRRGLPGQMSVLTVTSNGVETSPVTRGVWMLEKIFGTPPAPAPPDVPALEPDIRGAKTVRELLEKHREVKACADCHDRIDPLGYVFESFDPIGRLRETYESGAPIDTSGHYRSTAVNQVQDVRAFLLDHPDLLTRNLAEKMMVYALGRDLGFQDGDDVEQLIQAWKKGGLGLRDLIKRVVTSEPFLTP